MEKKSVLENRIPKNYKNGYAQLSHSLQILKVETRALGPQ